MRLHKDVDLKIEFLETECKKDDGLVKFIVDPNGYTLIGESKYYNQQILENEKPIFQHAHLANGCPIHISNTCFNQLKKQFTKYKREKIESHLVKKQYQFTKELSARIQYLKNVNGWAREETVIEHVINLYTNSMTLNKSKAQVETKVIKLQVLNQEIDKNNLKIKQLEDNVLKLEKDLAKEKSEKEHYQNLCKSHNIEQEDA